MIRPLATAIAGAAIAVAFATSAAAAPGSYYVQGEEIVKNGTGTATADFSADAFGQMSVDSSAVGGSKKGLLGTKTKPTTGSAEALVSEGYVVSAGTYTVTVTYAGARTTESATGNGAATCLVMVEATLATGLFEPVVLGGTQADLTSTAQSTAVTFQITFEKDSGINVQAEIQATSTAKGSGNTASTTASSDAVTFSVQKNG